MFLEGMYEPYDARGKEAVQYHYYPPRHSAESFQVERCQRSIWEKERVENTKEHTNPSWHAYHTREKLPKLRMHLLCQRAYAVIDVERSMGVDQVVAYRVAEYRK